MKEIEIVDKRGPKEKHFLQENGEFRAEMYDENIHYFNNGKFEEIDNTLILEDDHYVNKANENKVLFTAVPKPELMRIEKDNHFISFSLKDYNQFDIVQEESMSKLIGKIKYINVLKNVDICYDLVSSRVKESIYIKDRDSDIDKLVFKIDTDLDLKLENDSIIAMNNDECVFKFEVPFMMDSSGELNINVEYELNKIDNSYELKTILDKEWLNSGIKYPVIIDPTITNNAQNGNVYDTYIYPGDTNDDRNSRDFLKVGVERISGSDRINRSLLKFDLPTLGTGSQVISAKLNLRNYPDYTFSYSSDIVNIYRITTSWDETTATWNSMNDKFDSRVEGTFICRRIHYEDGNGNIILSLSGADITPLVQKWYTETPNYGMMLKLSNEVYKTDIIPMFFSKNNSVTGTNPKPYLIITYRNQNGLEQYMSYQRQEMSLGEICHNLYNGNLTTIMNIGQTIGGNLPANLKLVYNTNDVVLGNDIGYGIGYRLNYHQTIQSRLIENTNYLEYIDEDGTIHYFLNQRVMYDNNTNNYNTTTYENTFFDEDGLNLVIENNDNYYILRDKNKTEKKFLKINGIGYLTEIKDINNNIITISYDTNNRINKVTDVNENEINIQYSANQITIISSDDTFYLTYNNSNNLISVQSSLGVVSISNNNNSLITDIEDVTGKKLEYQYYGNLPYKIKKISEYGSNQTLGKYYEVTYGFNATTILDSYGRSNTITFNDYGNPVSTSTLKEYNNINDGYGLNIDYGVSYFGENTYKNKLLKNNMPIRYVKNFLTNSSFESTDLNDILFVPNNNVSLTTTTNYANTGFQSLRITCANPVQSTYQDVSVEKGKFYTFSGYFKTDNKHLTIRLSYIDENNQEVSSSSTISTESEFERNDVTIFYPSNANSNLKIILIMEEIGYYYCDDFQLEIGEVANNYNMIENSDFSNGLSQWTQYSGQNFPVSSVFEATTVDNVNCLKINMNTSNTSSISQRLNICGREGDLFNISFWYKHTGLLGGTGLGSGTRCNVFVSFIPVQQQQTDGGFFEVALNPNENEWQFYSSQMIAPWDFNAVNIIFNQELNGNEFYITNINMFKDIRNSTYDYDDEGNIIKTKHLDNNTTEYKYNVQNQLISSKNPKGQKFTYEYDSDNKLLKGVSEIGISTEYDYDEFGNIVSTKMINRGQCKEIVDGVYIIRQSGTYNNINCINNLVNIQEDLHAHCKWIIEKVTINNIDYFKIKHSIIEKYITISNSSIIMSNYQNDNSLFEFDRHDNGSFVIKNKQTQKFLKVSNNNLIIDDLVNSDPAYEFYFESITNSKFIEKSAEYTTDGRFISKTIDSNFKTTKYEYDQVSGLIKSINNNDIIITNYEYNNKNQISSISSGDKVINYIYNNNNHISQISQDDRIYKYEYDEFLNVSKVKIGNNITMMTNTYESNNGNLITSKYGNNQEIRFDYDEFGRIIKLTTMDNIYNYKYGSNGDLLKIVTNENSIKYVYDLAKRLSMLKNGNFTIKYSYDANNNIVSKTYLLNNASHTIDNTLNDGDGISNCLLDNSSLDNTYDELGRITKSKINNYYETKYDYVSNGKRTSMLIKSITNNNNLIKYKYNKLGNISCIYNDNTLEKKYYYDKYNELIREDDYSLGITIRYKYNKYGNMTKKTVYELDTYNQLENYKFEYNNHDWTDQLTTFNGNSIVYDNIGNPTSISNNISLTWINGRQLESYIDSNLNLSINYKYDKDGIRIKKTINNVDTSYYIENNDVVFETRNNDIIYYLRNSANGLIGLQYNNDTYYYVKNAQNDIIQIIDSNNNIVANYEYDSWGTIISITDGTGLDVSNNSNHIANINPYRYRSFYYDKETKLYYLNSRYYNPLWGRFINADNYLSTDTGVLGYNMYLYCNNNPINYTDPDGHGLFTLIVAAVVIVGAISLVNTDCQNSKAKKAIAKTQKKKVPDKTKKFNDTLKKNAADVIAETKYKPAVVNLINFVEDVGSGGKFDLKRTPEWNKSFSYNGIVLDPEDAGNINFGYIGNAIGYDLDFLTTGAGLYQLKEHWNNLETYVNCFTASVCDDPRDTYYITLGYHLYDNMK